MDVVRPAQQGDRDHVDGISLLPWLTALRVRPTLPWFPANNLNTTAKKQHTLAFHTECVTVESDLMVLTDNYMPLCVTYRRLADDTSHV